MVDWKSRLSLYQPQAHTDPSATRAAVALVLVPTNTPEVEILLIRRAKRTGDPWSGQMALPGGRLDSGDATLVDTAIRETREETGVVIEQRQLVGQLDDLRPIVSLPRVVVRPFVFAVDERPTVVPNEEVDRYVWVGAVELANSSTTTEVDIRGNRITTEAFITQTDIVWGMTHRILRQFLSVVNG